MPSLGTKTIISQKIKRDERQRVIISWMLSVQGNYDCTASLHLWHLLNFKYSTSNEDNSFGSKTFRCSIPGFQNMQIKLSYTLSPLYFELMEHLLTEEACWILSNPASERKLFYWMGFMETSVAQLCCGSVSREFGLLDRKG